MNYDIDKYRQVTAQSITFWRHLTTAMITMSYPQLMAKKFT